MFWYVGPYVLGHQPSILKRELIFHIKVCLQVLESTTAYIKNKIKLYKAKFVAPERAAWSVINWLGLKTTSLKT